MLHNGHRSKSPVDRVEPKVRREVIHQVILALPESELVAMAMEMARRANPETECTWLSFWMYLTCSGTSSSEPSGVAIIQGQAGWGEDQRRDRWKSPCRPLINSWRTTLMATQTFRYHLPETTFAPSKIDLEPNRRASLHSSGMHRLTTMSTISQGEQRSSISQSAESGSLVIGPILI